MRRLVMIIAYLIWKGSYNIELPQIRTLAIIAYLIWKGSYNSTSGAPNNA